jgi:type VI secretion system protein VasL
VNWPRVEQLCLALFREHGMELQSVTAFALARAHLHGLLGLVEGLRLTHKLLEDGWERLWPPALSVRREMLEWLFSQSRSWLRGLPLTEADVANLLQLDRQLRRLAELMDRREQPLSPTLGALRSQLQGLTGRLAPAVGAATPPSQTVQTAPADQAEPTAAIVLPAENRRAVRKPLREAPAVVVLKLENSEPADDRHLPHQRRLLWPWLLLLVVLVLLTGYFAWAYSDGWHPAPVAVESLQPAQTAHSQSQAPSGPVRLDGQLLFPPGKAVLRPESDKVLINSLIGIKAQPGWRIVVTGHSDSTGDPQRNLELSRNRAEAVRDWMQRMGDIPSDCFVVRGAGASEPVAGDETEEGRNANRRVEITLMPEGGACEKQ